MQKNKEPHSIDTPCIVPYSVACQLKRYGYKNESRYCYVVPKVKFKDGENTAITYIQGPYDRGASKAGVSLEEYEVVPAPIAEDFLRWIRDEQEIYISVKPLKYSCTFTTSGGGNKKITLACTFDGILRNMCIYAMDMLKKKQESHNEDSSNK